MQKSVLSKILLSRENLYRLGLAIFGFSFFPGIVFMVGKILFTSNANILSFYSKFYRSLLDMGIDGIYSWSIACAPYIAYDLYLLIKSFRTQKIEKDKKNNQ